MTRVLAAAGVFALAAALALLAIFVTRRVFVPAPQTNGDNVDRGGAAA